MDKRIGTITHLSRPNLPYLLWHIDHCEHVRWSESGVANLYPATITLSISVIDALCTRTEKDHTSASVIVY